MPDVTITLTTEDMKRLQAKANDERRTVENMALYLVAKALAPNRASRKAAVPKPRTRKPPRKVTGS